MDVSLAIVVRLSCLWFQRFLSSLVFPFGKSFLNIPVASFGFCAKYSFSEGVSQAIGRSKSFFASRFFFLRSLGSHCYRIIEYNTLKLRKNTEIFATGYDEKATNTSY